MQVEPKYPFRLIISILGKYPVRVQKGDVVTEFLLHARAVLEINTTIDNISGVHDRKSKDLPSNRQNAGTAREKEQETARCIELEKSKPKRRIEPPIPDVDERDLINVRGSCRQIFRRMLKRYSRMWDETLGEINTIHRIYLVPNTRPIAQVPYQTGRKAREIEEADVKKKLDAGVIERARLEWASPVLLVPKSDGSMRFCIDYQRLNTVTINFTYSLRRIEEFLDSLGDTKVFSAVDAI